jgi:hypothetical protein
MASTIYSVEPTTAESPGRTPLVRKLSDPEARVNTPAALKLYVLEKEILS